MNLRKHILLLCVGLSFGFATNAQAEVRKEDRVKTAIIYNLARFSEWPSTPIADKAPVFSICVAAKGPMQDALFELEDKTITGNSVQVIPTIDLTDDFSNCHILYISAKTKIDFDLSDLAEQGVLTIGDHRDFLSSGGGIAIVTKNNKLGFSINLTAMLRANIKPSSKILRLATEVR